MRSIRRSDYQLRPSDVARVVYDGPPPGRHRWRDRCVLKILAQTGLRRAEVAHLDVRDVDLPGRRLLVVRGKMGRDRLVPISADLAGDLEQLIGRRTRGPVFASDRRRGLSIRQVSRIVADAGLRAGVTSPYPHARALNPHIFRHTFARRWKDAGMPVESLSRILGHGSVATTLDLYGTRSADEVANDYARWLALNPLTDDSCGEIERSAEGPTTMSDRPAIVAPGASVRLGFSPRGGKRDRRTAGR
jgi:integrase